MNTKECSKCNKIKNECDFFSWSARVYKESFCKQCHNAKGRQKKIDGREGIMDENELIKCAEEIYKVLDKYGCKLSGGYGGNLSVSLEKIQMHTTDLTHTIMLYPRY